MAIANPITQALASAILHSTEPMVLSDARHPDNPMMVVNAAFEMMTGYTRQEILGRNCRFLQGPGTDEESARRIRRNISAGHGCIEWIVNHRKDGSEFWNLLFLSPVRDRDGTLLHFLGNQLDITLGFPTWLGEVAFGRAHMTHDIEAEFHDLLLDVLDNAETARLGDQAAAAQARALERTIATTRRVAEISTRLVPGASDARA